MIVICPLTIGIIGIIDYKSYKIPNAILIGWLGVAVFIDVLNNITPNIIFTKLITGIIVAGSYIPISCFVKASAGDFKLFAVLTYVMGIDDMLATLLITMLISLLPLFSGIKKTPIGFVLYFGYIAFELLRMEGLI
ncbi:MAG: prepilin peptidase [Lachnospiraceae bacterium]|nr:prepilin peptidase [Lachnospiraceae bacterium]